MLVKQTQLCKNIVDWIAIVSALIIEANRQLTPVDDPHVWIGIFLERRLLRLKLPGFEVPSEYSDLFCGIVAM